MRYSILWLFRLNYSTSSLSLPIAPVKIMRPLCLPALVVLVRGESGLAAAAVLYTWRGFDLGFSYSKSSGLNCLSSSPSGILALAVPGLFFKLKVSPELACASLPFISTAIRLNLSFGFSNAY